MKKKLYVVYDCNFRKRYFRAYEIENYDLVEYESFVGLKRLVSENICGQLIAISDELVCRKCWGDHWIEKAMKDILFLSKQNKVRFYAAGALYFLKETKDQLKAASIKYLNGTEIE